MVSTDSSKDPHVRSVRELHYELLTLGDELLLGLTANSHLTYIGRLLSRKGVTLKRNITLTDDAEAIAEQFEESWKRSDVVITTGGLGPTCDDRTREAIAGVLGMKLIHDAKVEKAIVERFAKSGKTPPPNNLKQALVFETGDVLPNENGTAPGLWIRQDNRVLVMLPGPPSELQPMFENQVLPRLETLGLLAPGESYVQLRSAGIGESALEHKLQPIFDHHGKDLSVAFCAHAGQVDLRLSSPSGALNHSRLRQIAAECALMLDDDFLCFGEDSLAKICAELLRKGEHSLAVAETATGGLLSDAFANVHGASKFFAGGCVCYSNEARSQLLDIPEDLLLQHGAVSGETAVAMATGIAERLGADYALAISGCNIPCSGKGKENPVGAVFIALYSPRGVWARQLSKPGPRNAIKQRVINAALDWLRRELLRSCGCSGNEGPCGCG